MKLGVDLDNVVDTSLDVVGDDDIGVVRGAEMIARRNHKLDRFLICKLERKGEQGSDLLAGVMAVLDNLAVKLTVHINTLVNVGAVEVEASHMLPEDLVEAERLVTDLKVDFVRLGNCYCFGINKIGLEESGNAVESFFTDSVGKFFGCVHDNLLPSG